MVRKVSPLTSQKEQTVLLTESKYSYIEPFHHDLMHRTSHGWGRYKILSSSVEWLPHEGVQQNSVKEIR